MNQKMRRIWSILLCFLLLIGIFPRYTQHNEFHSLAELELSFDGHDGHGHEDHGHDGHGHEDHDHEGHGHGYQDDHDGEELDSSAAFDLLSVFEDILELSLSLFATPV